MKTPNTRLQKNVGLATWLVVAAMLGFVLLRWPGLPQQVPLHYNLAGEIDRWGSKTEMLLCPAICLAAVLLLSTCLRLPKLWNLPVRPTAENKEQLYSMTKTMLLWLRLEMALVFFYLNVSILLLQKISLWYLPITLGVIFGTLWYYGYKERQLSQASRGVLYIDSEVTRLKNTFPVCKWWLLGPLFLMAIPVLYLLTSPSRQGWLYALLVVAEVLPFCLCYFAATKEKSVFYTEDTRCNLALNRLRVRSWTLFWVLAAYNAAVFGLVCFMLLQAQGYHFSGGVGVVYAMHVLLLMAYGGWLRLKVAHTTAGLLAGRAETHDAKRRPPTL